VVSSVGTVISGWAMVRFLVSATGLTSLTETVLPSPSLMYCLPMLPGACWAKVLTDEWA
jgi:hypothetical protein